MTFLLLKAVEEILKVKGYVKGVWSTNKAGVDWAESL